MKINLALVATLLCTTASLAAAPMDEQQFREMMGLEEYRVSYRDDRGADVGFDKFQEGIKGGKGYTIIKDPEKSTAVFQVNNKPRLLVSSSVKAPDTVLVKRGERLPEASLRDLDGRVIGLHSRGSRPLLINFFFAACAPCITETPTLNTFAKQRKDIDVVAVTFDDPGTARKFVGRHGFEWPIVPDGQAFLDKLGIKSFPSFVYLGKDGKLLGISNGSEIGVKGVPTLAELDAWIGKLEAK
jgi:thiol-disulfide isomerase/thioredoxin